MLQWAERRMSPKLVRDVMHRGTVACWADETLENVAQRLCEDSITAIFVVDKNGYTRGVISQTDIAYAYLQEGWRTRVAREIMVHHVVSVTGDTPLEVAIEMMLNRHIHRLLVVRDEGLRARPAGVLSLGDVICEMAGG